MEEGPRAVWDPVSDISVASSESHQASLLPHLQETDCMSRGQWLTLPGKW